MTVTWAGGGPIGNVEILVQSATDNTYSTGATAQCIAPASAGTFTLPPYVLLALPAGNFASFTFVSGFAEFPFTATGLSIGSLDTYVNGTSFSGFALK
jgi:hypothetical protein